LASCVTICLEGRNIVELRQLRYFLAVADNRSFVSAASSLYISRQAVSKAISQLETELGLELFVRDPSGAFLTPTGLLFYERVRGIIMDLDSLTEQMRTSGSRYHQRIRIAFSIGTVSLVEESLLAFREARENLEIVYSEQSQEECIRMLQEHQVDIIISGINSIASQFVSEQIVSSPIGVLLRAVDGIEDMDSLDTSDLSWLPLGAAMDGQIMDFCSRNRLTPTFRGLDYYRLFSYTESGKCALILPQCLVPSGFPGLKWVPLNNQELWKLYCTYPQSAESNLLYSFVLEELNQQVLRIKNE